jgi:hypothetical protein
MFLYNYRRSDVDMVNGIEKGLLPEYPRAGPTDDVEE